MPHETNPVTPPPSEKNLPVAEYLIRAYKLWHAGLPHIPKTARYSICGKIDTYLTDALALIMQARYLPKEHKLPLLRKAGSQLNIAQFFIRLLWEIKGIDSAQYVKLSDPLNSIGKMIGGWIRGLETKTPARSAGETK